jgi:hypothetical protein
MRRRPWGGQALAAAALVFGLSGFGGSESAKGPSLRLTQVAPLEVVGAHFRSHERVRLIADIGRARDTKRIRASGEGAFLGRFAIGGGHCTSVRVRAVGSSGSKAQLKLPPRPACMPF